MLDLNYIRQNTSEVIGRLHYRSNPKDMLPSRIKMMLTADAKLREAKTAHQANLARRNAISGEIGKLMGKVKAEDALAIGQVELLKAEAAKLALLAPEIEAEIDQEEKSLKHHLLSLPNLPVVGVPAGRDETHNVRISQGGTKRVYDFKPKDHVDLGAALGIDFETAGRVSGSRFVYLTGKAAKLERALGQYMLDFHVGRGWLETNPPLLVRADAMRGTGQLPKFEEDLFKTTDDRYLIPTAEVSLTNMVADQIVPEASLPMRMAALTPCFRAEAGSAGRDTRGMIRQHQFNKVELVAITEADEEKADELLGSMVDQVCAMLMELGLHFRVMLLCAGDMGFSAAKTFDIEVWLPGQDAYREISSISYFTDFQGRRMNARYKGESGKPKFVHTLNGSGVAVGRALVAVLETYQQADGSVQVPLVLQPYMGGLEVLKED